MKKAIFFTVTAWRKQYGESVLHAVDAESAQRDPVIYRRAGVDDVVLAGWQKVSRIDEDTGDMSCVYIGQGGQACTDWRNLSWNLSLNSLTNAVHDKGYPLQKSF